jgi:hypothetical protein
MKWAFGKISPIFLLVKNGKMKRAFGKIWKFPRVKNPEKIETIRPIFFFYTISRTYN